MKSKAPKKIEAIKYTKYGMLPLFVQFGHKSLEKSKPPALSQSGDAQTFLVPKDILRVTVSDPALYEGIESIELTYSK